MDIDNKIKNFRIGCLCLTGILLSLLSALMHFGAMLPDYSLDGFTIIKYLGIFFTSLVILIFAVPCLLISLFLGNIIAKFIYRDKKALTKTSTPPAPDK